MYKSLKIDIESIVKKCLQKDTKAQRELYEHFKATVYTICKRYFTDTILVEDAFQESFILIFNKLNQWDPKRGELKSWIYSVTINTSISIYNREKKIVTSDMDESELIQIKEEKETSDNVDHDELEKLLNHISKNQRIVFNLYAIEGYKHKEIADLLKITESTSRSLLTRAREKLKEMYNQTYTTV